MSTKLLSAAAALALFFTPVAAQEQSDNSKAAIEMMSKVTKAQDFLQHAAMGDMFEMRTAELANERSQNQQVQQFAQMLIKDHGAASQELMNIAQAAGIQMQNPTLDQRHQTIVDSLSGAEGQGFDTAFAQTQVQAHQEAIALYEAYAQNGDNEQMKAFAQKGLPVLQQHLQMAQQLQQGTTTN